MSREQILDALLNLAAEKLASLDEKIKNLENENRCYLEALRSIKRNLPDCERPVNDTELHNIRVALTWLNKL